MNKIINTPYFLAHSLLNIKIFFINDIPFERSWYFRLSNGCCIDMTNAFKMKF